MVIAFPIPNVPHGDTHGNEFLPHGEPMGQDTMGLQPYNALNGRIANYQANCNNYCSGHFATDVAV